MAKHVKIGEEHYELLSRHARRVGMPRAEMCRRAIDLYTTAHRNTDTATVSPASDTYTASLSATTNASAFSHSFPGLSAADTMETV